MSVYICILQTYKKVTESKQRIRQSIISKYIILYPYLINQIESIQIYDTTLNEPT